MSEIEVTMLYSCEKQDIGPPRRIPSFHSLPLKKEDFIFVHECIENYLFGIDPEN